MPTAPANPSANSNPVNPATVDRPGYQPTGQLTGVEPLAITAPDPTTTPDGSGSGGGPPDDSTDPGNPLPGAWVDAADLQPGQLLHTTGTWTQITTIQVHTQHATVHNLTVTGPHTYHVLAGTASVLVHNCGEATVYLDKENSHALISVTDSDETLSTHQFGGTRNPRNNGVATFDSADVPSSAIKIRVPLSRPQAAMAYAEVMMDKTVRRVYPAYDLDTKSCVTYCAQVLRAGGVADIPTDTMGATRWLFAHDR